MKVFNFYNDNSSMPGIDIVIDSIDYDLLKKNKREFTVEDIILPLPSISDLVQMKKKRGGKSIMKTLNILK